MNQILNFDIEQKIKDLVENNLKNIKLFFILFAINIFIYGQKIFFYSLATDDYGRFYNGGGEQASWLGRWMAGIMNQNVFTGAMHILPYFNGVIGIFSFSLAGFLTAKILKRTNSFEISIITLLISATPMVADNLHFNTNTSTWVSTLLGIIGLLLAQKANKFSKILGLSFVVIAIGCYQTIVQVAIAIAMIKAIIDVCESKDKNDLKVLFLNFAYSIAFVLLAYAFSHLINHLYVQHYNLEIADRFGNAVHGFDISVYWHRLSSMFHNNYGFRFFKNQLTLLYKIMGLLALCSCIFMVIKGKQARHTKIILSVFLFLMFLYIPLVNNLPNITGYRIPLRAYYTVGWFMAGFFIIQMLSFKKIFKTASLAITLTMIVLSVCYINIFFDSASRQTTADLIRVNQIVGRIRTHENYTLEPIKFKIIGTTNKFSVIAWNSDQQALNADWSKEKVFKNFSDLNFTEMTDAEFNEVEDSLIKKGQQIDPYPAKNSIVVKDDKVVLFLNSTDVNAAIAMTKIQKLKPNVQAFFNLYLADGKLIYFKSPCSEDDVANPFYLHVLPVDPAILPENQKSLELYFPFNGTVKNNQCILTQQLPNFPIKQINTGQFNNVYNEQEKKPYTIYWKSSLIIQ
jgi:hypothetical protein